MATVHNVRRLRIVIADSSGDLPYTRFAREFDARLTTLGIPHIFTLYTPSHGLTEHAWRFWADLLPTMLRKVETRERLSGSRSGRRVVATARGPDAAIITAQLVGGRACVPLPLGAVGESVVLGSARYGYT